LGDYALDQYRGGVARRRNPAQDTSDDEPIDSGGQVEVGKVEVDHEVDDAEVDEADDADDADEVDDDQVDDDQVDETDDAEAYDDEVDEAEVEDEPPPPPPRISSTLRRLSQWRPPPPRRPLPQDKSGRVLSEKQIVDGLDSRERLISSIAAILALALAVALAVAVSTDHVKKVKGQATAETALIVCGVLILPAAVMLVGVFIKRRALVGFTSFLLGFELYTFVGILSLPYFVVGGWLLLRAYRLSKLRRELAVPETRSTRAGRASATTATGRATGGATGRGTAAPKAGSRSRAAKAAPVPERKPPPRSKRYTPPKGTVPRRSTSKPR
jgi:hypothetical protein